MNAVQFLRLADRLANLPPVVREVVEHLASGRLESAAAAADGRGSPDWWSAEFFLSQLSDHGISPAAGKGKEVSQSAGMSLFS